MTEQALRELFGAVAAGRQSIDQAVERLRHLPFEDLGFAKVDHHRAVRCGFPEVIYCGGKTVEQIIAIFTRCAQTGANLIATRASKDAYTAIAGRHPQAEYHDTARAVTLRQQPARPSATAIAIVSAGTSDLPVAEEARVTAEIMDQETICLYDVGVAGIHRVLAHTQALQRANVIVVVAGMEGALPSVVGGLVSCPVIAVPTSIGYGASLGGIAALLSMLNSCASGVTVVNIDNGFGAGYTAALINRRCAVAKA
jgi:hypothetical protein